MRTPCLPRTNQYWPTGKPEETASTHQANPAERCGDVQPTLQEGHIPLVEACEEFAEKLLRVRCCLHLLCLEHGW
jgi:hypothetical protein